MKNKLSNTTVKKFPDISINILNFNGKKFIKECIDSVLMQDYQNFKIVFVDNGSTDGSIKYLKNNYSREIQKNKIKILSLEKNSGFTGGYNFAYKENKSKYFLLLNNDVILPDRSMIKKMIKKIESDSNIATVYCMDLPPGKTNQNLSNILRGGMSIVQTNIFDNVPRDNVFYPGGVCCLVRGGGKKGLFPEDYFAYAEDVYLGAKYILEGYKNVYLTNTYLFHHGAGTSGKGSSFTRFHSEKNRLANIIYFYKWKTIIKISPLLAFQIVLSDIFYLIRPKIFFATIRGQIYFLLNLRKLMSERREIQKNRRVEDYVLIKNLSCKIFTEEIATTSYRGLNFGLGRRLYLGLVRIINTLSFIYCKIIGLKTREFYE